VQNVLLNHKPLYSLLFNLLLCSFSTCNFSTSFSTYKGKSFVQFYTNECYDDDDDDVDKIFFCNY